MNKPIFLKVTFVSASRGGQDVANALDMADFKASVEELPAPPYAPTEQELATILAALRYYQEQGLADDPAMRSDEIHDIATNNDNVISSLDGAGIDALCEKYNFGDQAGAKKHSFDYKDRDGKLIEKGSAMIHAGQRVEVVDFLSEGVEIRYRGHGSTEVVDGHELITPKKET
jgi:hypothetical protein